MVLHLMGATWDLKISEQHKFRRFARLAMKIYAISKGFYVRMTCELAKKS